MKDKKLQEALKGLIFKDGYVYSVSRKPDNKCLILIDDFIINGYKALDSSSSIFIKYKREIIEIASYEIYQRYMTQDKLLIYYHKNGYHMITLHLKLFGELWALSKWDLM